MPGGWASLSETEQAELAVLVDEFPHDAAEARASPKQIAFQQAFVTRQVNGVSKGIFIALGGNRGGKTFVCGWLCLAKFIRYLAKDGAWFWCISQTLDRSISGQQREIWESLPRHMFGDQSWDEKNGFGQHRKVVLPTSDGGKCLIEFRSADQDKSTFEQAKLDGVWIDERLPEEIYNRLLARIVDRNGFILYSDIPEQQWQMERLVEADPAAGVYCEIFGMEDNRANLPPGAIELASIRMTEDERKLRIKGEFVVMEGVVFKEFVDVLRPLGSIAEGIIPGGHLVKPFKIPDSWPKFRAIDYGGSAPTGCLWFAISALWHIYLYREYYERRLSVEKNAQNIAMMSGDEKYVRTLIDPCAFNMQPGMTKLWDTIGAQYGRHLGCDISGWPVVNVMGEHAMVQKVKYRLENRTLWVFESLTNCRREFRSWKYKLDKEGRPVAADSFDVSGPCHLLDCLKGFVATNPTYEQLSSEVHTDPDDQRDQPGDKDGMIMVAGQWRRMRLGDMGED